MTRETSPDDKLTRLKVKSEKVDVHLVRLVSKSFALKCLRRAWPDARIQVLKNPPKAISDGYKLDEHPDHEVWQVFAAKRGIEVAGPREVLGYCAVREAFLCIAHMKVTFAKVPGGINFTAELLPKPDPHAQHGRTAQTECECFGSNDHAACAKSGCAVCKTQEEKIAQAMRAEAETAIDKNVDRLIEKNLLSVVPE